MALKQVLEIMELVDSARASGEAAAKLLRQRGLTAIQVKTVKGPRGSTDFVKAVIPGKRGKTAGGKAGTLGVIGRLGGLGARPTMIGLVSDGDGAVAALATALKLADMQTAGDVLLGDVIVATHICPDAPTKPHTPVPFMGSPVEPGVMNRLEVDGVMDAILSIDTTKGNRIVNHRGIAISPTVKEGWVLRVSDDLLDAVQIVTGRLPVVLPISTQDITPYGNDLYHLNSIMQPCTATAAPVVGVAITAETPVPGCATGASHAIDIELAVRFSIEVAKRFGQGACAFHNEAEFARILKLYGPLIHLQTLGKSPRRK
jgi:hypothetical protein